MTEKNIPLYSKYRPSRFDEIIGKCNEKTIQALKNIKEKKGYPHVILFTGQSGLGKTTLARIVANDIFNNDPELINSGVNEINMSDKTGIDDMRHMVEESQALSFSGERVYILDEIHNVSKQAQDCLLKYTEDVPSHLYWILCTDNEEKLDKALRGRSAEFKIGSPKKEEVAKLLQDIAKKEGREITEDIAIRIAGSSANIRKAIQNLEAILNLDVIDQVSIIDILANDDSESAAWFQKLVLPMVWPFMVKEINPFDPSYFLIAIGDCLEESSPIELVMGIAGYCRNRLTKSEDGKPFPKFMYKSSGEKKSDSAIQKEYQVYLIMLKHLTKINYTLIPKPENRVLNDLIELFYLVKEIHTSKGI